MNWPPTGLEFNLKNFPKVHQISETVPNEKEYIRICRCWQSKKFPYCDDAHKALMEAGDNVGPYVARFRPKQVGQAAANAVTNQVTSTNPRNAAMMIGALAVGWIGGSLISKPFTTLPEDARTREEHAADHLAEIKIKTS